MDEMRIYEAAEKLRNEDYLAFMSLDEETRAIWYRVQKRLEGDEETKKEAEEIVASFIVRLMNWLGGLL